MTIKSDFAENKDTLGQDLQPFFIKAEDAIEKKEKIDHSKAYELPTIKTRYIAILIDVIAILLMSLGISALFEKIGSVPGFVRGILFVVVVILYEPILVSFATTLGQLFMNIRVRDFNDPAKRLPVFKAIFRFAVKVTLGWLSFITVTFNVNRRAIHDFMSGSVMIANKIEK